jgi:uncharacterized protein YbjQ (UPF0145 family)
MIISTMDDLPGSQIDDAVLAFRFDTSELGTTWTEICAHATAVRATKQ